MTVCTPYNGTHLKKGKYYSKKELFDEIEKNEFYAATYFDPDKDMLFTFFDERNRNWENIYNVNNNNELQFRFRSKPNSGKIPVWEAKKKRHVFLRHKKQDKDKNENKDKYEFLGTSIGETSKTVGSFVYRVFRIL
jgi:hypothetical protein